MTAPRYHITRDGDDILIYDRDKPGEPIAVSNNLGSAMTSLDILNSQAKQPIWTDENAADDDFDDNAAAVAAWCLGAVAVMCVAAAVAIAVLT